MNHKERQVMFDKAFEGTAKKRVSRKNQGDEERECRLLYCACRTVFDQGAGLRA